MARKHGFVNQMEFNKKVQDFGRSLREEQKEVFLRAIAMHLLRGVVLKTPVQTGRAQGGWDVSMGDITSGETGILDKSGGMETIRRGMAKIEEWISLGAKNILFIFNNVPYIIPLEDGGSQQAPHGMMKVTFTEIAFSLGML